MHRDSIPHVSGVIVLIFIFTICSFVYAAGGSGGSDDDGEGELTGYIAIGVAILVTGLLVYDAISDNDDDTEVDDADSAVGNPATVDTGIDWDAEFEDENEVTELVVAVFPWESGFEQAVEVIEIISENTVYWVNSYPEPVELGTDSAVESAQLAESYFNADYLLLVEHTVAGYKITLADSDSVVWSVVSAEEPTSSVIANTFLERRTGDRRN